MEEKVESNMSETKSFNVSMSNKVPGCYEISFDGGGELPDYLKGKFYTTPTKAEADIEIYLNSYKRGAKRGNRTNQSRTD